MTGCGVSPTLSAAERPSTWPPGPYFGRHVVLADEERAPVEHRHAPIERRGQVLLGDDELGFLEQRQRALPQLLFAAGFAHAERKAAVGLLQDARQPQQRGDLAEVVPVHHQCPGQRNAVPS
jgi:hypothetical protein